MLTLKPFDDGLKRRPDSNWDVVSLDGEIVDITVTLLTIGEAPPNKVEILNPIKQSIYKMCVLTCACAVCRKLNKKPVV